jgi:hypothetical protein
MLHAIKAARFYKRFLVTAGPVVYHGSQYEFDEFKNMKVGDYGPGFYFSTSKEDAADLGSRSGGRGSMVRSYELFVENPLMVTSNSPTEEELRELSKAFDIPPDELEDMGGDYAHPVKAIMELAQLMGYSFENQLSVLKKLGYDGIFISQDVAKLTRPTKGDYWAVFNNAQIKPTSNWEWSLHPDLVKERAQRAKVKADEAKFWEELEREKKELLERNPHLKDEL